MFKKILVAYDEGKVAAKALDTAIELAKGLGGDIYVASACMAVDNISRREQLEKCQSAAADKVLEAGLAVYTKIEVGGKELGQTVAKIAKDLEVDLIVMGSHNRGAVGKLMFGSVSDYVLRNTACPVLIVK